jgi:hypothetical protein
VRAEGRAALGAGFAAGFGVNFCATAFFFGDATFFAGRALAFFGAAFFGEAFFGEAFFGEAFFGEAFFGAAFFGAAFFGAAFFIRAAGRLGFVAGLTFFVTFFVIFLVAMDRHGSATRASRAIGSTGFARPGYRRSPRRSSASTTEAVAP